MRWVEDVEGQLDALSVDLDLIDALHTSRYWRIRQLHEEPIRPVALVLPKLIARRAGSRRRDTTSSNASTEQLLRVRVRGARGARAFRYAGPDLGRCHAPQLPDLGRGSVRRAAGLANPAACSAGAFLVLCPDRGRPRFSCGACPRRAVGRRVFRGRRALPEDGPRFRSER